MFASFMKEAFARQLGVEFGIWIGAFALSFSAVWFIFGAAVSEPDEIPWVGVSRSWPLSRTVGVVRSLFRFRDLLAEANDKYLSKGQCCRVPDFIFDPLIVLPSSKLKWILSQPKRILHPTEAQHDLVQMERLLWFANVPFEPPMQGLFPQKWMTARSEAPRADLMNEISQGLADSWGKNTETWATVNVNKSLLPVVSQAVWFALVGRPLCREKSVLRYGQLAGDLLFPTAQIVRAFPSFLRPVAAAILGLPTRHSYHQLARSVIPLISQRVDELEELRHSCNRKSDEPLHGDYLTWLVQKEWDGGRLRENSYHRICSLVLGLNFAATQSTTLTASSTITSLTNSGGDSLVKLRNEVESVLHEEGNNWTKRALSQLTSIGSAIRETLRLNPIMAVAPVRTLRMPYTRMSRYIHTQMITKPSASLHLEIRTIRSDHLQVPITN